MIETEKVIVMDIDGTLCESKQKNQEYIDILPKEDVLSKLREYKSKGYYIILSTSRQMRTYNGNVGQINANTGKVLFEWLEKFSIPFDEIYLGKPWCGFQGFYVDDKAIRPDEFVNLSTEEIHKLIKKD